MLLIDIIGQYKLIIGVKDDPIILKYLFIIYPTPGWSKIVQYNDKQSDAISNLVDQAWMCIYPTPTTITYNRGNESLSHAFKHYLI